MSASIRYANAGDIDFLQDCNVCIDWRALLKNTSYVILIMSKGYANIGYAIVECTSSSLIIQELFIIERFRRYGWGTYLVRDIKERCKNSKRKQVTAHIDETNLIGQLFLRYNKFIGESHGQKYFFIWSA